ncbi:Regulator of protease activity HflC, stomatin/prohibitin superfamily [Actinopolyspora xinjiangensis]|uniref:Regulator of protease activity HflC, stomatin/prohibitin superfamily n=1 Tax=Actinopolyspora xinjiangensis TaxID=405564 RepID=A0A1H0QW40_9ACTN|nr:slipin family protein [Actinopolyspora xinjiangensis]SDP21512.1 Regulator of protease activity HflC, stomatin/prohibitin superfamily [Actinopolyspora xinjiangensis]
MIIEVLIGVLVVLALLAASSVRIIRQYERGVVLRFGRLRRDVRQPGLTAIVPAVDRLRKVNMQIITMPVPAQEGITRDNVTVRVDAVVYFNVTDPTRAVINVEDYLFAMGQVAQASLRSIIGKSDLDDLLSDREKLNQGLEVMIDSPALNWGVHIDRVEIKDVSLPEAMKRSIARQAEAERERRSRIISADGEFRASRKLSEAASVMERTPAALQLRLLETVVEVAAEKNSTLVLPFPVELLRFVDHTGEGSAGEGEAATDTSAEEGAGADLSESAEQPTPAATGPHELPEETGAGAVGRGEAPGSEAAPSPVPEQSQRHGERPETARSGPT